MNGSDHHSPSPSLSLPQLDGGGPSLPRSPPIFTEDEHVGGRDEGAPGNRAEGEWHAESL